MATIHKHIYAYAHTLSVACIFFKHVFAFTEGRRLEDGAQRRRQKGARG
jgi:hypothetical protein